MNDPIDSMRGVMKSKVGKWLSSSAGPNRNAQTAMKWMMYFMAGLQGCSVAFHQVLDDLADGVVVPTERFELVEDEVGANDFAVDGSDALPCPKGRLLGGCGVGCHGSEVSSLPVMLRTQFLCVWGSCVLIS